MPPAARRSALIRPLDLPGGEMARDILGIECRTREGPDAIGGLAGAWRVALRKRGIVEVRPKYRLGGAQQLRRQRCLPPPHHLRIEPGRLRRVRTGRTTA